MEDESVKVSERAKLKKPKVRKVLVYTKCEKKSHTKCRLQKHILKKRVKRDEKKGEKKKSPEGDPKEEETICKISLQGDKFKKSKKCRVVISLTKHSSKKLKRKKASLFLNKHKTESKFQPPLVNGEANSSLSSIQSEDDDDEDLEAHTLPHLDVSNETLNSCQDISEPSLNEEESRAPKSGGPSLLQKSSKSEDSGSTSKNTPDNLPHSEEKFEIHESKVTDQHLEPYSGNDSKSYSSCNIVPLRRTVVMMQYESTLHPPNKKSNRKTNVESHKYLSKCIDSGLRPLKTNHRRLCFDPLHVFKRNKKPLPDDEDTEPFFEEIPNDFYAKLKKRVKLASLKEEEDKPTESEKRELKLMKKKAKPIESAVPSEEKDVLKEEAAPVLSAVQSKKDVKCVKSGEEERQLCNCKGKKKSAKSVEELVQHKQKIQPVRSERKTIKEDDFCLHTYDPAGYMDSSSFSIYNDDEVNLKKFSEMQTTVESTQDLRKGSGLRSLSESLRKKSKIISSLFARKSEEGREN